MGIHFLNLTIRCTPDPMKPNILIYEPVGKELQLVAVEWLVPLTAKTSKRPSLFGKPFDGDRKSTRLNSSHLGISYAVFCLKKKKRTQINVVMPAHIRVRRT